MKRNKTILLVIMVSVIVSQIFTFSANAEITGETVSKIPDLMAPNTIIEYTCSNDYTIIQGGEAVSTFSIEEENTIDNFELLCEKVGEKLNRDDFVKMEMPEPAAGTKVYYDADGYVKEIQVANVSKAAGKCPNCGDIYFSNGCRIEEGTGVSWGGAGNYMYNDGAEIYATGRFTNFTDTVGQNDYKLGKGDVATRFHVDNPRFGQVLECSANNHKARMVKRDVGCLPNAILDIWKTGVEKFGYTWNENLSINNAFYCYLY